MINTGKLKTAAVLAAIAIAAAINVSEACAAAKIARAFGMRVLGYSRTRRASFEGEYVSFDELLEKSDVVSLHCRPARRRSA